MSVKNGNKYLSNTSSDGDGSYFGLGRTIDIGDQFTRIALLLTLASGAIAVSFKGGLEASSESATYFGVAVAAQFFFTWLVAQELDPDRKIGGLVGAGISVVLALTIGVGDILVMFWMLFILRLLNRTSGSRHKIGDNIILMVLSYWLGKEGFWLYPTLTGIAYVVESKLPGGYIKSMYLGGLAFAITALANIDHTPARLDAIYVYLMIVTFILFLPEISMAIATKFLGEKDHKRINPRRLQAAQGMFLLFNFMLAWFSGNNAALSLSPSWAAAMGVGLYLLYMVVEKIIFGKKEVENQDGN